MILQKFRFSIWGLALVLVSGRILLAVPAVPPYGTYEGSTYSPTITVLESNDSEIRLRLEMEHLPDEGSTVWMTHAFDGLWGNMLDAQSNPIIPRFTIYLALPRTGNPTLSVESWQSQTHPVGAATTLIENAPENPEARLGTVGVLGGVRVVPLTVKPVEYVNNATTCDVLTEAELMISIDSAPGLFPLEEDRPDFSPAWQRTLQSVVTNWEAIPNIDVGAQSHMLVICPSEFLNAIQGFVDWKEQRGMKITVLPLSDIGANPTALQIRNSIISEYEASSPLIDYVLLVGDETKINPGYRFTADPLTRFSDASFSGSYTDENRFAALVGHDDDDVFPDLFVGRWVANTVSDVLTIANRTIYHERDVLMGDAVRFSRCAVAADFTEATQRLTKIDVRESLLGHGFTRVDTLWGASSPGPTPLINWTNNGLTFINYRGSGWSTGWAGIGFYVNHVGQINNTGSLPIVTGIGCGVAKFDESTDGLCFGERWMTQGTITLPSGAVGFIGPSWNTHTVYNDCLDSCLYKAMLDYDILNLAPALAAGKMYTWGLMEEFIGEEAVLEVCETMFRQYLVLSDPSLQVYTQTPVELDVSHPEAIPSGFLEFPLTISNLPAVPADSLLLTIWYQPGDYSYQWIDRTSPTVSIAVEAEGVDSVYLTITGENVAAYHRVLMVDPEGPFVSHAGMTIDDGDGGNGNGLVEPGETIRWTEEIWNIGSENAVNVTAALSTTSPTVNVTSGQISLGTIASGESVVAEEPFEFILDETIPDETILNFNLLLQADNAAARFADVTLSVYSVRFDMASVAVNDGGNGLLERWESAHLEVDLMNSGNIASGVGTCTLLSDDEYISVAIGTFALPSISAFSEYSIPSDRLQVHASGTTPSGHEAAMTLRVTIPMDSYTYTRDIPFALTVGAVSSQDPLADTAQRYWLYDNTDDIYHQVPDFNWIEISPSAGGPGTAFDVVSSQQTFSLQLPFSFDFYGVSFDSISISTDGWIAPGETDMISFQNHELPYISDNVFGMLAPMWDDLWYRFADEETGDLGYYYDEANHRFIVEWYQVHHWQTINPDAAETFQVHLLDPASYPTPTGDAEWLFLYQTVSPLAESSVGGTVGIESPVLQQLTEGATYMHEGEYAAAAAPLTSGRAIRITTVPPTILDAGDRPAPLPEDIALSQNFPNPFNPRTSIAFTLPSAMRARLEIFNLLGQRVTTLIDAPLTGGTHLYDWDGRSSSGVAAASGVYLYRLVTPQTVLSRKMVLLK